MGKNTTIGFYSQLNWSERVRAVFRRYRGWAACAITAIMLWICLHFCLQITNDEGARYLLSAISQGLAAILALVFMITLVAAQMTRRYTAMDMMFKTGTVLLMLVFAIGIVLPLIILKTGSIYVNECIALATFCVLSLIPHLKGVNTTLKYDVAIDNLGTEAMDAIEKARETSVINTIEELAQVGVDAAKDLQKVATSHVAKSLRFIGKSAAEEGMEDAAERVVYSLSKVGEIAAKNKLEGATRNAVIGLIQIGERSIEKRRDYIITSITNGLISIGVIAARKRWKGVVRNASGFLEKVSVKFAWQEEGLESASGLWILGASAEKYLILEIVDERIHELHKWESSTSNDSFEEAFIRAREGISGLYPNLKSSFEEFKRRYDNR
jgi:hypothetical protein